MVKAVASSLTCPSCGAGIEQRAFGWAVTVVCSSCGAVLDANDPNLQVLQRQESAIRVTPKIPLGTRGTWHGAPWEVIGFQVVTITVDDTDYSWTEYVAFNPFRGFLYLSEYQGHWNVIEKLHQRPEEYSAGDHRPVAEYAGDAYKHFQTAVARTTVALGEFPWQLRVGDRVVARDFVDPPYILSAESSENETTWSRGTYTSPEIIAKAFGLPKKLMAPVGVFANQPNPYVGTAGKVFKRLGLFLAVLALMFVANVVLSRRDVVYSTQSTFVHGADDAAAYVTPAFELQGRPSSVTIDVDAQLDNDWMFMTFTLINETSGESREASRQVSYYSGTDSDGKWTEGSRRESVRLASVPSGKYFLRVAPEGGEPLKSRTDYSLRVRRDVPSYVFYFVGLLALVVPALFSFVPAATFESRRWAESDYASATGSADDGDDE